MKKLEFVRVAGWGSDRHAREVRAGISTARIRSEVYATTGDYLVMTARGVRRLILDEYTGKLYTRLPTHAIE